MQQVKKYKLDIIYFKCTEYDFFKTHIPDQRFWEIVQFNHVPRGQT